jgi:HK97 gp10 family phage protein
MITIKCDLKDLEKTLNKLAEAIEEASQEALEETLDCIKQEAKSICPVRTGALKASIDYRFDKQELSGEVYAGVPYAIYVELGTRYTARPFLHPSFEVGRAFFEQRYLELIEESIKKIGG